MSKNIQMNIKSSSGYEEIYPQTLGNLVSGKVNNALNADYATSASSSSFCSGNSSTASKLYTARNLKVSLSTTSSQSFDGSSDATSIGVSGTLPASRGGTGYTSLSSLGSALSSYISAGSTIVCGKYIGGGGNYPNDISVGITNKTPYFWAVYSYEWGNGDTASVAFTAEPIKVDNTGNVIATFVKSSGNSRKAVKTEYTSGKLTFKSQISDLNISGATYYYMIIFP